MAGFVGIRNITRKIREEREKRGTFIHERQVEAEAEALIIVERLRSGELTVNGEHVSNAYFVSHTRIIDRIGGGGQPITMPPEAVRQWVATLRPTNINELSLLTNSLLWELSERGMSFVDNAKIRQVFNPLTSASKEKLDEEVEHHRDLISQQYGVDASKAFREADVLDVPIILESYYAQRSERLDGELRKERRARREAEAQAKATEKDRQELGRLKRAKEVRKAKNKREQRAAVSRPKGRSRRRGKRGK